jgi:bifunctional oligoribonuclease and PAP phosphatase NrnA
MPIDWAPFVEMVGRSQRFLLTTHVRPDGDGLGSMQALALALRELGKEVACVVASTIPPRYAFLNSDSAIEHFTQAGDRHRQADVVIVLDTGTWNQLGAFGTFLKSLTVPKIVIDHHPTQDDLGATRFVDTTAEATGRLAYEVIRAFGVAITEPMASALFVAVAMDTGWFRHSNARTPTFELAAKLVSAGARPEILYDQLYEENTLPRLKLMGLVLDRLQTAHDGRVAYSEIRRSDYAATGATPQDTEDLVNFTRSVRGVEVGLFFMEQPRGGVKVSFRSRARIDVGRVAEQFGGGGHRLASGAIIETTLDEARQRVLQAVQAALDA